MSSKAKQQLMGRQNVSTACNECRSSKLRCDGKLPTCGRCIARSKTCLYQTKDDKRRIPLKKSLEVFGRRIRQLETFIELNHLELPPLSSQDRDIFEKYKAGNKSSTISTPDRSTAQDSGVLCEDGSHPEYDTHNPSAAQHVRDLDTAPVVSHPETSIDPWGSVSQDALEPPANPIQPPSSTFPILPTIAQDADFPPVEPFVESLFAQHENDIPASTSYDYIPFPSSHDCQQTQTTDFTTAQEYSNPSTFSQDEEESGNDDELVKQLSNRMGHLHMTGDGQFRYYGATSNFNLAKWQLADESHVDMTDEHDLQDQQARDSVSIDASLEVHFENLYFAWQDPCYHVTDRTMYEQGKTLWVNTQTESTFYTQLLTSAMCAFGALFHNPKRKAEQYSKHFTKKAKKLLDRDLDSPKVATVQALVILSSVEAAATGDARGWLYSGMAMRLAFDLGLHVDMASCVIQDEMTEQEAKARCTTFWGCYIVDHLWGFYLGRPFHTNTGNITVQKPKSDSVSSPHSPWAPYGPDRALMKADLPDGIYNDSDLIQCKWVLLCESMDALGNLTYGCSTVSEDDLVLVADATMASLTQWQESLPQELQVDPDDDSTYHVPHLLLMHMQYYQIIIHVHRPFVSKGQVPSESPRGRRFQHSRDVCIDAAFSIAKLIILYQKHYTLRRINIQAVSIIFSAALILVFASISTAQSRDRGALTRYLDACSDALAQMGGTFENAARSLDLLLMIKRAWQARLVTGGLATTKRRRLSQPATNEPRSKAPRADEKDSSADDVHRYSPEYVNNYDNSSMQSGPFDSIDWRYMMGQWENGG